MFKPVLPKPAAITAEAGAGAAPRWLVQEARWPRFAVPLAISLVMVWWLAGGRTAGDVWVLTALAVWALAWRRRASVPTFAVCGLLTLDPTDTRGGVIGVLCVLVSLYNVAFRSPLSVAALVEVSAAVGFGLIAAGIVPGEQQERLSVATERPRIAREMHDIVAHGLAVVITMAHRAPRSTRSMIRPSRSGRWSRSPTPPGARCRRPGTSWTSFGMTSWAIVSRSDRPPQPSGATGLDRRLGVVQRRGDLRVVEPVGDARSPRPRAGGHLCL